MQILYEQQVVLYMLTHKSTSFTNIIDKNNYFDKF